MQEMIGPEGAKLIALSGLGAVVAMIFGVIYNAWTAHRASQDWERKHRRDYDRRFDDVSRSGDDL